MQYPIFLYKSPGPHYGFMGTYKYCRVMDDADFAIKTEGGYWPTIEEAIIHSDESSNDNVLEAPTDYPKRGRGRPRKTQDGSL